MSTMRDFLRWYNNRDVIPFVEALQKQQAIYREKMNIDMLRHGISIPGICMRFLFKSLPRETYFTLFGEKDKDLYHMVRSNIVGGPSIIFHRYHEAETTLLRTNKDNMEKKMCKGVTGYDANSLYLWALQQDMPTGWFWRWTQEDKPADPLVTPTAAAETTVDPADTDNDMFHASTQKFNNNSHEAFLWLQYMSYANNLDIRTSFNHGEKRIGRRQIPVDGFDAGTNTIYQFHGC